MIQPLAYVHPSAKIADNVTIDPFVTIHKNVEIDEGTWIGPNVTIFEGTRIGKNCRIFPGASIGAIPQDLKFDGEETLTIIGNNTTVREYVTINKGTKALGHTKVGSDVLLMAYVHLAHDCIVEDNCILANSVQVAGHVHIGEWAILGGAALVHQFVKIGRHAMVSGGSLVRKDVPPYTKAAREPLSYEGVNSIGLRRRNFNTEKISEIQDIYRTLFVKGHNTAKAITIIETEFSPTPERDEILLFLKESDRGIMKGFISK
ncbi:MAG: acyl-ACP--UDP-N-acetylglucosamine O-acyltransferase [Bacteroidetes bacterium]|nr:acyl-ACP--UDP-N-acetylglucosamine O-acyltransferase [Bacteroidota bacterium]